MTYTDTVVKQKVGGLDVWVRYLIVASDTPVVWPDNSEITDTFDTDTGQVTIHYVVDGQPSAKQDSDKYYYWFPLLNTYMTTDSESQELQEVKEAFETAVGGAV